MTDSFIPKAFILASIEEGIAKALALDSSTRKKIADLPDFVLQVTLKGIDVSFFVLVQNSDVKLASYNESNIDCSLACYPTEIITLFSRSPEGLPVLNPRAEVEGNREILFELYEIFSLAEPDYEAELARWLGPIAGHQAGRTLRSGARWFRNTTGSVTANLKLYLREEVALFPHPVEVEQFYQEIAEVEQQVARLATRVETLKESIQQQSRGADRDITPGDAS